MTSLPFAVQMTVNGKPSIIAAFNSVMEANDYTENLARRHVSHCRKVNITASMHETNGDYDVAYVVNTATDHSFVTTIYETITLPASI